MIRAAVAGLGWWGRTIVGRLAGSDRVDIRVAVELDPDAHRDFAGRHGLRLVGSLDDVWRDPEIDAVILCTPHSLHAEQVLAAAAHGKHVFCEKPLALRRADAERSVAACREAGVVLGIGHERRFEHPMAEIRRLVREGALGTILHAEGNFNHDKLANVPANDWRRSTAESPAAGMTAMGIHLTDALIGLLGPVRKVYAATASRVLNSENGDVVSALMHFDSGATGYINAILVTPHYLRLTVFGSKAWVELRNETHPDTVGPSHLTFYPAEGDPVTTEYAWNDSVRANIEAFADSIENGTPYLFTDEEKIANVAVLEAVCRSAETGEAVACNPTEHGAPRAAE
jgi:predicted dehydrogenase